MPEKDRFFALAVITLTMQFSSGLIILILATAVVFTAGCTQGTGAAVPVAPASGTPSLSDLAIKDTDVPACFTLSGQSVKSSGDVGKLAKELGWQSGYVVTYTCPSKDGRPTVIVHSLAVYPAENMAGIVSMVDGQDRANGYSYEDLVFPDQGSPMRGFYGKANETQASGQSPGTYLVNPGREVPGTTTISGGDVAEIIFFKGRIFEVLKITGPGTNTTVLRDMARNAYAKIP